MEPLDPKAELMRLARECGDIERQHCIGKAQGFDVRDAYIALESAITLALAAERRPFARALQLLRYWCPQHLPLPYSEGDQVASSHNNKWCDTQAFLADHSSVDGKAGGT